MPGNATVDHAIVDALHTLLEGTRAVHIVGVLADGPRERLAGSLEGRALSRVCDRLETDGWAVEDATPVTVPLALMPFDPRRIPKTVLAYLYARHPEIETYCFRVRARRAGARPLRPRPAARPLSADFPTMRWKTEAEWGGEVRRRPDDVAAAVRALDETARRLESLRLDLVRSDEELLRIKSSLTWQAVVKYRTLRERLLPPQSGGGRLYERVRSTIRRLAVGGD